MMPPTHRSDPGIAMKRCVRCILPENYPGVTFDDEGTCSLCAGYRARSYLGEDAMRERILSFLRTRSDRNVDYDCVLGFSGGRDSTFLLYYLVKRMRLRTLACFVDNGLIPDTTFRNIEMATETLGVRLAIERHDYLKRCLRQHLLSWMRRPSASLVTLLCTGCRLGMWRGLYKTALSNQVPVVVVGTVPFEAGAYKKELVRRYRRDGDRHSLLRGYLHRVLRNPRWIADFGCLSTQVREFLCYTGRARWLQNHDVLQITPFLRYFHWKESDIISTITQELGWRPHSEGEATWRRDCGVAMLKSYMYKTILGFNDVDDNLSCLVRDGQIDREEALARLRAEGDVSEEPVERLLGQSGIEYREFKRALERATVY